MSTGGSSNQSGGGGGGAATSLLGRQRLLIYLSIYLSRRLQRAGRRSAARQPKVTTSPSLSNRLGQRGARRRYFVKSTAIAAHSADRQSKAPAPSILASSAGLMIASRLKSSGAGHSTPLSSAGRPQWAARERRPAGQRALCQLVCAKLEAGAQYARLGSAQSEAAGPLGQPRQLAARLDSMPIH